MSLNEKLNNVVAKHEELQNILATRTDLEGQEVARLSKELADLTDIVRAVTEYRLTEAELADLTSLIEDPRSDKDVRELAAEELRDLKQKLPELEREMQLLLLPKDAADEKNAILEVRAGTGGDEAALFAADLFRMYQRFAERHNRVCQVESQLSAALETAAQAASRDDLICITGSFYLVGEAKRHLEQLAAQRDMEMASA